MAAINACKGICHRYKQLKRIDNIKKCTVCSIRMKFDGNRCPCCNFLFTNRIRNASFRHKKLDMIVRY
jgi:hypothetical protein